MSTAKDPDHWLYRLTAEEWLAAARTELAHAAETLGRRAFRPGVTHARRAAGMAWNAVLVQKLDPGYGRSYMDHVAALARDDRVPDEPRQAAAFLRDTPPVPPELITLGKPDMRPLQAAQTVLAYAEERALTAPAFKTN